MLELASGTGQHAAWFGAGLPGWTWQPTEANSTALPTIAAWVQRAAVSHVRAPALLDVADATEALSSTFRQPLDAIFCTNLLHIAPWSVCGPFIEGDVPTAPGNLDFDASLRRQHPGWGIRQREAVERCALAAGLRLRQRIPMPANNLLLVFEPV